MLSALLGLGLERDGELVPTPADAVGRRPPSSAADATPAGIAHAARPCLEPQPVTITSRRQPVGRRALPVGLPAVNTRAADAPRRRRRA
jgi:hypothetical protein